MIDQIKDVIIDNKFLTIVYIYIFTWLLFILIDVKDTYINILLGSYLVFLLGAFLVKNYMLYKDNNKRGLIKFYVDGLAIVIPILVFFLPGAAIGIGGYQFINTNFTGTLYTSLIIIGFIVFVILLSVLTLLYLFTALVMKIYLESRVESYFRGWSYWDERIVEDLKEKDIDIENVEYNENGVFIEINEENFVLEDHLTYLDSFISKNIHIE